MTVRLARSRATRCLGAGLLAVSLAGCQTLGEAPTASDTPLDIVGTTPPPDPIDFSDALPTETFRLALQHFKRTEYGLAERYFRATVEKDPANFEAWIGLAASYDHIRRFDLADRAYAMAIRLSGESVQVLNNQGFSYMSRGDFKTARAKFNKALRLDPNNQTIVNNLRILDANDPALIGRR